MSRSQGHSATGRIMLVQNYNDTIRNRTRDPTTCSAVPQPTATPLALAYSAKLFCDILSSISVFGMIKKKIRHGFPAVWRVRQCNETATKGKQGAARVTSCWHVPYPSKQQQLLLSSVNWTLLIYFAQYDVIPLSWLPLLSWWRNREAQPSF